jgi:hypothetical protein
MFVDLVKAYDTVNHELLFQILERYGAPTKYVNAIRRLYSSLIAKISIGGEKAEIPQTVGVRQGDNLSPVIFLFLMSACAESLQDELDARGMEKAKCRKIDLTGISQGQLVGRKPKDFKAGEEFELFDFYYVDDGAFVFTSRDSLVEYAPVVDTHLAKFGLEMHVRTIDEATGDEEASKTECMFIPPPGYFKAAPIEAPRDPENANAITTKPKRESAHARTEREAKLYNECPETDRVWIDGRGFIDFTRAFKYLGSMIYFDLRDDFDIGKRVSKASQMMGAMKNVWDDVYIDMYTKYLFFLAIPVNLLLWGCETWALKEESTRKLDVFIHRSARRILNISMTQEQEERIRNSEVRKKFFDIPTAERMIAGRQLTYLGKVVRNKREGFLPKKLLTAWVDNKRPKGGVLFTNKKSLVKSLEFILPPIPPEPEADDNSLEMKRWKRIVEERKAGDLRHWINDAMDQEYWEWMIDQKIKRPHLNIPPPRRRTNANRESTPQSPPPRPQRPHRSHNPPSPPPQQPSPPRQRYNPERVGRSRRDLLLCLGLEMQRRERSESNLGNYQGFTTQTSTEAKKLESATRKQ